jgi:hypothetical protein
MIELVSGMLAPLFVSERIRTGSRFKRFLYFVLIVVRYLLIPPALPVPRVENKWYRKCGNLDDSNPIGIYGVLHG